MFTLKSQYLIVHTLTWGTSEVPGSAVFQSAFQAVESGAEPAVRLLQVLEDLQATDDCALVLLGSQFIFISIY